MNVNKLAVFVNQAGGIDSAANIIGIEPELLQRAIENQDLNVFETAEIETAFNQLYLEPELAFENDIDLDELENAASELDLIDIFIDNENLISDFKQLYANGEIDNLDAFKEMAANLNTRFLEATIEWIKQGNDASELFDNYETGGNFWDLDDSEFWAWYRETFY